MVGECFEVEQPLDHEVVLGFVRHDVLYSSLMRFTMKIVVWVMRMGAHLDMHAESAA